MDNIQPVTMDALLKDQLESGSRLHWFHWLIVALSFVLTFGAWYFSQSQVNMKRKNEFDRASERVIEQIIERMRKYEDALWGGVSSISSHSDSIDYKKWKRFSHGLKIESKYPGINGIGVIYHVPRDEQESFLAAQKKLRPNFKIHPAHQHNELLPITYIEPLAKNAADLGLDIAHETNRYTAAKKARSTGVPQITGPIALVHDAKKTPGFLFYAPFYKDNLYETPEAREKNFVGMVYAPFIFKNLMEGTLEAQKRNVGIKIKDGGTVLLDENHAGNKQFDANPLFQKQSSVHMYGRNWLFEIQSKLSFRHATENHKPWIILLSGICLDFLLVGLFVALARSNRKAIPFAEKMAEGYQNQAELLTNVVNEAVDGLITINEKGIIGNFNPACERIFGYRAEEVIGENIKILMPEPYQSEHDGYLKNYQRTHQKKIIGVGRLVQGKRKNGEAFPLDLSVSQVNIKGNVVYSGIVRDVTEREGFMNNLVESNLELERFAYVASHDLQEPLRMITNFTGLLEKRYAEQLDDRAKEYIAFASNSARHMQDLVEDLLEYARIGEDMESYQAIDVAQTLAVIKDNLNNMIDGSGAKIRHDDLPIVHANPIRFMRVLQNLIGNSLKYQSADRTLNVYIQVEKQTEAWLFTIRDNGIGMKPEYCQKIFEPFKRLHGKGEYSGTGMGLAICRKIINGLGGDIWAESVPNEGSYFYFTIPIKPTNTGKTE